MDTIGEGYKYRNRYMHGAKIKQKEKAEEKRKIYTFTEN